MEALKKSFYNSSESKWEQVAPKIKRKITGYGSNIMMVLVHFEKGGIGDPHYHVHSQTTYIESGAFEVLVDNETKLLKKGDCFFAGSNTVHGVVCKEEGVLVDVFSPVREDFLKN